MRAPELVSLERWNDYVEESRRGDDALLKEVLCALDLFLPHLALRQEFERTVDPAPPPVREYYEKILAYCLETGWATSAREPG